jgi:CubicO group peptidase (beta-lactamase class C family)
MKKTAVVLAMCLIGRMASAQVSAESSGPATGSALIDPVELENFMDGAVEALLEAHDVAGGTVSVVKDGEIFFAKGYGLADAEEGTTVDAGTSMFRIASISKLFAWTAVMQLWEQGKVDLDQDVNTYLDFEIPTPRASRTARADSSPLGKRTWSHSGMSWHRTSLPGCGLQVK